MKQAITGLIVALAMFLPAIAHTGARTAVHNEGRRLRQQISNGAELAMKKATLHGHASDIVLLKHNSSNTSHGKSHSLASSTSMKNESTTVHNDSKNVVAMADHVVHETINRTSHASGKVHGKKVAFMQFTQRAFAKKAFTKKAVEDDNDKDMSDDEDDDDDDDDTGSEQKDEPSIRALRKNVSRLDGLVDINVHDQRRLESEIKYLDDKDASAEEIQSSTAKVVNETSSPALGRILRKMWSEMRMYAWPFYQEHLENDLQDLKNEEQQLQMQLTTAEDKLEKAEKADKEEKDEKEDKRKKKEADGQKDAEEEDKKDKKEKKDESNEEKSREKKEEKHGDKETDKEKEDEDDDEDDKTHAVVVVPVSPSPSGTWSPAPAPAAKMSVKKRAVKKQKPEYEPLFTEETMPAISPTLQCVLVLVVQFFITYTAHAIFRTMNQFGNQKYWNLQRIAEEVCRAITYAPALSVLFLATRMRAIQLSGGETEKYELPPLWVQIAMYVCTFSLPVQAITVLISASMQPADEMAKKAFKNSKKVEQPEEGTQLSAAEEAKQQKLKCSNPGEMDTDQVQPVTLGQVSKNNGLQIAMTVLTSLCLIAMYGGAAVVCVGALTMEGPEELWKKAAMLLQGKPGEPPVSTTLTCTMILVTAFFIVYLARAINRIILDLKPEPKTPKAPKSSPKEPKSPGGRELLGVKLNWIFTHAQESVSLAPMLCVLFIAIRMRALQVNPQTGNPQIWARHCMVASVALLIIKVLAVIILPLCDAKTSAGKLGTGIGEQMFPFKRQALRITAAIIKHASVLLIIVCAVVIRAGIFLIQSPEGPDKTPHVSPAVLNVITLCDLFFMAHAVIYVMQTLTDAFPMKKLVHLIAGIAEAGHKAVMYAPMLAVLYLGCRMRALQLTRTIDGEVPPTAGPQFWAQEAMYVATFALLVRMLCSYLDAALRGSGNTIPQDFSETTQLRDSDKMSIAVVIGNYVSLFVMYTAAIVIMVGIFLMTPETLPPYSTQ